MKLEKTERMKEIGSIAEALAGTDTYYTRLTDRVERALDRLEILAYYGVSEQFRAYVERKAEMLNDQIELHVYFV